MTTRNVELVSRYFDCINHQDWDGVAEVTIPELSTAVRDFLWRPHPDLRIEVEWMAPHDDRVSVWCYASGTHQNPWELPPSMGSLAGGKLEPSGKSWRMAGAATYRVADDRIADVWAVWDWLGLLTQLGVVELRTGAS